MKVRCLLFSAVLFLALAAHAAAQDARVTVAVGLLDNGEDAKVVSVYDFKAYRGDYEDFQRLLAKAPTLRDMARHGWRIAHVSRYEGDMFLIIFER